MKTLEEEIVGMNREEAVAILQERCQKFRIISVDNEPRMRTMDYVPSRLNLSIVDGKVVSVGRG